MANTTRQNSLLVNQDWTAVYQSFTNADFTSYDFQTLRKSMVDYLRTYYPEDFNDYTESSEYIALLDLLAFLGQSLAFRTDLNARENFIDTAQRKDSILKLARLISYVPKRNITSSGYLKFDSIQTTESLADSGGIDLTNSIIKWNDASNLNWYEQFITIIGSALPSNQKIGQPANSQIIGSITNDEYNLNLTPGQTPVFKFSAQINNSVLPFEIVSPTSRGQSYIYEVAPQPGLPLNILYKNDNLGNASNNTGFFLYFKQGSLQTVNFNVAQSIPNNAVNVNVTNVNNSDVWLYQVSNLGTPTTQWTQVPAVTGVNIIYNNGSPQTSYQVNSRAQDQITLVFGDGTFAAVPQGNFVTYVRASSGLSYNITPDEMQNITLSIPYTSRLGRTETLTVVASLKYTVSNATVAETVNDIRQNAPPQYYTQNRMITGEDYNTFPYTNFSTISKVKAVNRTSSGVSRYLDIVDTTGRYSSTNIFADDGILFEENHTTTFDFTWTTTTDINKVIQNQIQPAIRSNLLEHFYYANFNRYSLSTLYWHQTTSGAGSSTGYFVNGSGVVQQVGIGVTGNNAYIQENCIIIFNVSGNTQYVGVSNLYGNGNQTNLSNGKGPVWLTANIPTGATAVTVIPAFGNDFSTSVVAQLITLISSYTQFGVSYNQLSGTWNIITAQNLDLTSPFSQTYQGNTTSTGKDASWLVSFTVNGPIYTVTIRGLSYVFESVQETQFYYDGSTKIYDPTTGLTVNDYISVLKVNGDPDTGVIMSENVLWWIYDQVTESDGYVDNTSVQVTFSDVNNNGIPDNPDIFKNLVNPTVNPNKKYVFFEISYDYGSFVSYIPVDNSLVNTSYATNAAISPYINNYPVGQIFYATTEQAFYVIDSTYTLTVSTSYIEKIGRQSLYFQYRHNAPGNNRIDPSPANLIDLYILTKDYDAAYRAWALDTTGTVKEPDQPNSESLRIDYSGLDNYKAVSDAIIYNPATFKPLFGKKAATDLQATIKVIQNVNTNLTASDITSQVLAYINAFFATGLWDFGETFYFTELATYIQQSMAPNVSSIIIVPNSVTQVYGSLQQISANPNEILISCATAENIEVITSITASQLNLSNQSVNNIIN